MLESPSISSPSQDISSSSQVDNSSPTQDGSSSNQGSFPPSLEDDSRGEKYCLRTHNLTDIYNHTNTGTSMSCIVITHKGVHLKYQFWPQNLRRLLKRWNPIIVRSGRRLWLKKSTHCWKTKHGRLRSCLHEEPLSRTSGFSKSRLSLVER